jgi:hypothetical protein
MPTVNSSPESTKAKASIITFGASASGTDSVPDSDSDSGTVPATVSNDGGDHLPLQTTKTLTQTQTKKSEASKHQGQGQGPSYYYEEEDQEHTTRTVRNVLDVDAGVAKKKAAFLGAGGASSSSSSSIPLEQKMSSNVLSRAFSKAGRSQRSLERSASRSQRIVERRGSSLVFRYGEDAQGTPSGEQSMPGAVSIPGIGGFRTEQPPGGNEDSDNDNDNTLLNSVREMRPEVEGLAIEAEIAPTTHESAASLRGIEDRLRRSVQYTLRESIVQANIVENVGPEHELSSQKKGPYYCMWLAALLLFCGAAGGVLAAVLKPSPSSPSSSSSSGAPNTVPPSFQPSQSPQPTSQPSLEPTTIDQARLEAFRSILIPLSGDSLSETSTAAFQALEWIALVDQAQLNPDDLDFDARTDILERYALALLYFSTSGPAWRHQQGYLNASSVCDWIDLTCTDGRVANITLANNLLVGTVPFYEMAALSELGKFHHCMHAATAAAVLLTHCRMCMCMCRQYIHRGLTTFYPTQRLLNYLAIEFSESWIPTLVYSPSLVSTT